MKHITFEQHVTLVRVETGNYSTQYRCTETNATALTDMFDFIYATLKECSFSMTQIWCHGNLRVLAQTRHTITIIRTLVLCCIKWSVLWVKHNQYLFSQFWPSFWLKFDADYQCNAQLCIKIIIQNIWFCMKWWVTLHATHFGHRCCLEQDEMKCDVFKSSISGDKQR